MSGYESNAPADAPIIRKLSVGPSEAPNNDEKKQHAGNEGSTNIPWHKKTSIEPTNEQVLGSDVRLHLSRQHHLSFDRSIAAGVVILGALATTFLVAVFCYIRTSLQLLA